MSLSPSIATQFPYKVLLLRGVAEIREVEGLAPEYIAAASRYFGEEQGEAWVEMVGQLGVQMVRVSVVPRWARVLDFETRFPSALAAAMAAAQWRDRVDDRQRAPLAAALASSQTAWRCFGPCAADFLAVRPVVVLARLAVGSGGADRLLRSGRSLPLAPRLGSTGRSKRAPHATERVVTASDAIPPRHLHRFALPPLAYGPRWIRLARSGGFAMSRTMRAIRSCKAVDASLGKSH